MKRIFLAGFLVLGAVLGAPFAFGQVAAASPFTSIVDRNGKKLSAKDLPPGVLAFANEKKDALLAHYPATLVVMVAAAPVSPEGKRDLNFGTHLFGQSWSGFTEQQKVGDIMVAVEPLTAGPGSPDILTSPVHFGVERMGSATMNVPLPMPLTAGSLVWLGDVKLKADPSPAMKVTGEVTDASHKVLDLTGTAYLYVRCTPMEDGLAVPIKHGHYTFPAVHMSNDYLFQGMVAGYDIKPNFAALKADGTAPGLEMIATELPTSAADVAAVTAAHDGAWLTSYSEAKEAAVASKKPILMDFTGSDWCGWCIQFDKDVLSKPDFAAYAKDHLVLLRLDYPHMKSLPPEQGKQNAQLQILEKVEGFPTYVLMSGDGKELFRQVGYAPGGPAPFIAKLTAAVGAKN